ncbi:MAG: tRNA (adenosine(37)-N6)-dimethylallyltransferase MiaA [Bacteroidota bacterium]
MTKVLIAIVGPTAIGKTSRAISLAHHFNTEIFSADSRQFFKEMQIGTAVPSALELEAARHHFIQRISIFDTYSVGDYEREAIQALQRHFKRRDIAILVGGSGLYMDALLYGLDDFPKVPEKIRNELNEVHEKEGITALQGKLKALDSQYYSQVDLQNPQRLIRALEVCISSGKPYSSFLGSKRIPRDFKFVLVGLHAEREIIYDRINQRVDQMLENGLIEEAKALYPHKHLNALNTVGYKELFDYFEGNISLEIAIAEIKKNTRRFAKRQLTWYRKNKDIHWLSHDMSKMEFINLIQGKIKSLFNAKT